LNAFLKIYRGGAVAIDGRGIVKTGEVDKSEASGTAGLEFSVEGRDVFEDSFEIDTSSSSTSFSDDSVSFGDFGLS